MTHFKKENSSSLEVDLQIVPTFNIEQAIASELNTEDKSIMELLDDNTKEPTTDPKDSS